MLLVCICVVAVVLLFKSGSATDAAGQTAAYRLTIPHVYLIDDLYISKCVA